MAHVSGKSQLPLSPYLGGYFDQLQQTTIVN